MKSTKKTYTVQMKVTAYVDVEIRAESMEEALQEGKSYTVLDVIEIKGGHNDSEIEVTGVFG